MKDSEALAVVEQKFGTVEDLAWALVNDHPEVFGEDYNLVAVAKKLKLPSNALGRILRSEAFRSVMTQIVVKHEFTLLDEVQHVKSVKKDALDSKNSLDVRTKAREYLAMLEGRPFRGGEQVGTAIQINFGHPSEVNYEVRPDSTSFKPKRSGELPPKRARRTSKEGQTTDTTSHGVDLGSDLDLWSDESPYATLELGESEGEDGGNDEEA